MGCTLGLKVALISTLESNRSLERKLEADERLRPHLDVESRFCTGFDEQHVEVPRLGIALLDGHLPAKKTACST